jgi:hypothetical protein
MSNARGHKTKARSPTHVARADSAALVDPKRRAPRRAGAAASPLEEQLVGLRAGQDSALVIGRKEYWNEQGTGFDALVARLDGKTGALEVRELDASHVRAAGFLRELQLDLGAAE